MFSCTQGDDDDDEDDDEYLSDLAEELENQLMDILSEDEIIDVVNTKTSNVTSQQAKTYNTGRGIATDKADGSEFNSLADKGESFLETITESVEPNVAEAVKCNGAIGMDMSEEGDRSDEDSNGSPVKFDNNNDDNDSLSAELAEAAGGSDSVYKDILDNIVNEILGDTIGEVKGDEHVGESIKQTVYCDDTTLIRTPVRKTKSHLKPQIEESHDTDSQGDTSDIEMFKSPKSLKERLRDATQIISPINTRHRSAQKLAKSKSKGSPCLKKADSDVVEDSDSKDSLDNAQNNKCSENTGDQNGNLNRSDTGEFTPAIHELDSPSTVSKEKTGFFIPGQESTCVHSMKDLNINVTKTDGDSTATKLDDSNEKKLKNINDNAGSPKPVLKRQMALRKDSASEIPEKKICSEPDDTSQSSVRASRRITRSKSMPNKFIKFQKGSCETLEEERAKFDVSKGGYEKPNKTELDTIKDCKVALEIINIDGEKHVGPKKEKQIDKSAAKQNDTPIDTQNDASLAEQSSTTIAEQKISLTKQADTPTTKNKSDTPIAKQTHTPIPKQNSPPNKIDKPSAKLPDTPIARRTRRSSRLQSLPETNTDKTSKRRSAPSILVPSKDETKNSDITEKDSLTNDTSNDSKSSVLLYNNDENSEKVNEQKDELIENSSVFEEEPAKCEIGNTSLRKEKAIEDLPLDFKGDSIKSVSENIAENSSYEINIDSKGEVSISSPDIANSENSANKATPSRQLSTGFLLQSHKSSCKQKEHTSPFRLKETIIEENDIVTENNSNDIEASVILDVNDILNDSVNERSMNRQTDMSTQKDMLKDKKLTEDTAVTKDLTPDVDNKDSKADKTEQLSEDIASPVASPFDLFKSASQSVSVTKDSNSDAASNVSWLEPGTSGNKSVTSRSGSVTPADNFSENDTPVPSPLPMSLFEMVELISPLPPTPTPMYEPLSPLSEDGDPDKTLTEDDLLKSPEATNKTIPDITVFNTPESKPYSKMDMLHFTPLPAMLSPIVTPKRLKSVESATQMDTQDNDSAQKPCQFINQVPTSVSIKPKPVHASELNETVTQELDTEIDGMENKLSKDDTSPSHKENVVPNTNAQHSVKSKPLKLIQTSHKNSTENISKIGAKEKATNLDKDTPDTVDRIHSKLSAIQKTPGDSEKTATETKPRNTIPEMAGGYDNLVASKTKKRQAHQNKIPRLPLKK